MTIYRLSETCAVAPQIQPGDISSIANDGYTTIVCNRPDNEDIGQPAAEAIAAACAAQNIAFHFIPIDRSGITTEMVDEFRKIVADSEGMILAYCRSGQRSSILWQASGSP